MDILPENGEIARAFAGQQVLVTGGAGFIGGHVVDALVAGGAKVRVLDDYSTGDENRLAEAYGDKVPVVMGTLLDGASIREAVAGVSVVFHLAAACSVPQSVRDPGKYHLVNTTGTALLLEASRHAGVKRVVFSASSAAYGNLPGLPKTEAMPTQPLSPYAASKVASEAAMCAYAHSYGVDGVCDAVSLRYFNVYGDRQNANSSYAAVIAGFAKALMLGQSPVIYGDGQQTRDFVSVHDVVQANLRAGACETPLGGQVMNVGTASRITVVALWQQMATIWQQMAEDVSGVGGGEGEGGGGGGWREPKQPVFEKPRTGEVMDSVADIGLIQDVLGFEPKVSLADGLKRTLGWYAQQPVESVMQ